ncbi:MAG: YhfC family glutamic-type intramembrane protease [Lachnospiraceae bacterium]|nr:YhfC family glutamic-type intramembrane protease [Lachnospiraceae bacterium]
MFLLDTVIKTDLASAFSMTGYILLILPIAAFAIFKFRSKCKLMPLFGGIISYLVFTRMGSQILFFILNALGGQGLSDFLTSHMLFNGFLYALCYSVVTALGIFVCLKFVIKECRQQSTAMAFGLGFGGAWVISETAFNFILEGTLAKQLNSIGLEKYYESMVAGNDGTTQMVSFEDFSSQVQALNSYTAIEVFSSVLAGAGILLFSVAITSFMLTSIHYEMPNNKYVAFGSAFIYYFVSTLYTSGIVSSTLLAQILEFVAGAVILAVSMRFLAKTQDLPDLEIEGASHYNRKNNPKKMF